MNWTRLNLAKKGRTKGGKLLDVAKEEHYLRRLKNLIDGLDQEGRKRALKILGFLPTIEPAKEAVVARLKSGEAEFAASIKAAGEERYPGCGTLLVVDVGLRHQGDRHGPRILGELKGQRRLSALHRVSYYKIPRTDRRSRALRRKWPGLVKEVVTVSVEDSTAILLGLRSGDLIPADVHSLLSEGGYRVARVVERMTKLKGAEAGLAVELVVWHLQQGQLHCHLYLRDIDIYDPKHKRRLGLFGHTTTAGLGSKHPRLTLNPLGPSGLAMRRHRKANHEPSPVLMKTGELITDWRLLEIATKHREAKGLGRCWDVVASDFFDSFFKRRFSSPKLRIHHLAAKKAEAERWARENAEKNRQLVLVARQLLGQEMEQNIRKAKEDAQASFQNELTTAKTAADQHEIDAIAAYQEKAEEERAILTAEIAAAKEKLEKAKTKEREIEEEATAQRIRFEQALDGKDEDLRMLATKTAGQRREIEQLTGALTSLKSESIQNEEHIKALTERVHDSEKIAEDGAAAVTRLKDQLVESTERLAKVEAELALWNGQIEAKNSEIEQRLKTVGYSAMAAERLSRREDLLRAVQAGHVPTPEQAAELDFVLSSTGKWAYDYRVPLRVPDHLMPRARQFLNNNKAWIVAPVSPARSEPAAIRNSADFGLALAAAIRRLEKHPPRAGDDRYFTPEFLARARSEPVAAEDFLHVLGLLAEFSSVGVGVDSHGDQERQSSVLAVDAAIIR